MKGCLLFIFIVAFFGLVAPSWADKTHTVKKGDTLYRISKKYKTDIGTITQANNLDSDKLVPGTKLLISSVKQAASHPVNEGPETYTVKKGDSLWKIGKRYSVSVKELRKLNNLKSRRLKPGQELVLAQPSILEIKADAGASPVMQPLVNTETAEAAQPNETTDPKKETPEEFLMFIARQTLGIPYKFGSSSNRATDCSGYVQRVFSFMGIQLPRSAREQFNHGVSVEKKNLSIGDLVFFRTYAPFPSHVGIYLGNNLFVHASTFAKKVTIDSLDAPYYIKRFIGAKHLPGFDELDLSGAAELSGPVLR
ncbi:MAG: LysM peptidoglycan-binding domain-containing protein [Nitrospirae bacterium]|nr:LysM peptidoglycan-binding domain-containing protein [Nitrospirota bacterium]